LVTALPVLILALTARVPAVAARLLLECYSMRRLVDVDDGGA
jgi:hypothetical protein